ncbi:LysM domain-containing protein [Clostridium sp. YIM B02569]|uniref:LysM peptidoglycan-binding domain-containing protein n=1 Tax=Clostridium sp. YIM B02569 TaxID=2911967 RepID=UPI001EEF307C|nr:LysM domain-containing protein [Clostridium sp. YIM B02569]
MGEDRRKLILTKVKDNFSILFPLTPFPKFSSSMNISTAELFGHGETDTGAIRNLTKITMDGILPHPKNNYDFVFNNDYAPGYYTNYLYDWMVNQNNLLMSYRTDTQKISHLNCRIEKFDFAEEDGSKNIKFNLTLREYRENKLTDSNDVVNSKYVIDSYGSDTYYVGEGDTLITIAAKLYGDSSKWNYLMNKNNLKNPLILEVGQGLKI